MPARTAIRRDTIGFVYQFHHLLGEFTALENVVLPQMIAGRSRKAAGERAMALLASFGLEARAEHQPGKLSGGEQQRVAIARALANAPKVLLADEPTGNLDVATASVVFEELLAMVRRENLAALIATHNPGPGSTHGSHGDAARGQSGGAWRLIPGAESSDPSDTMRGGTVIPAFAGMTEGPEVPPLGMRSLNRRAADAHAVSGGG